MNPFAMLVDIFRRAAAKQPLTPIERGVRDAIMRGVVFQLFTALVAGGQAVLPLFSRWDYQWGPVLATFGATIAFALLGALYHSISSLGDAPLADALGIITNLTKQFAVGGSAAFLAALHQTDRTNFVLKLMQGLMQLQVPSAPVSPPVPAQVQSPPLIEKQPMQAGARNG